MNGRAVAAMLSFALAISGCANVHVKKVSLAKRVAGHDGHVKGFRYYTSRPYIVVGEKVDVAVDSTLARLVKIEDRSNPPINDASPFGLESVAKVKVGETLVLPLYNLQGEPLDMNRFESAGAVTASADANAAAAAAAAAAAGAKTIPAPAAPSPVKPPPASPIPDLKPPPPPAQSTLGVRSATLDARAASNSLSSATRDSAVHRTQAGQVAKDPAPTIAKSPPASPMGSAKDPAKAAEGLEPADVLEDASETPPFQVVFLPDFEEQFAIRNKNLMAKSQYNYHFTDGWSLVNVSGTWNATDVPVRFLQTLGNIFGQAATFEQDRIKAQQKAAPADKLAGTKDSASSSSEIRFEIRRIRRIEPGMYRIQKSWERVAIAPQPAEMPPDLTSSLLSDLGLPVSEVVQVVRLIQDP